VNDEHAPHTLPTEIVIDDWTPVAEPVELGPDEGIQHQAYTPLSAVLVAQVRQAQEAVEPGAPAPHLTFLDPWTHMTLGEREDHLITCLDGCETCEGHRSFCFQCGHDVDTDDEYCGSCGEHWPGSKDFSDVKGQN
jgi:hypothetical protein